MMLNARRTLARATAAALVVRGLNSHARLTPAARRASMADVLETVQLLGAAARTISVAAIAIAPAMARAPATIHHICMAAATDASSGTAASIQIAARADSALRQGSGRS